MVAATHHAADHHAREQPPHAATGLAVAALLHEARLLQLNCDKAHQLLGWYPRWHAEQTLEATAVWYKTIMNGGNAEQITRAQIHEFFPELI